ncbi:RagB/SusD family nutrient uptake outer membrane protein [Dyadobacter sp. CY343]|uniref:RagB/SusD family nutrient uptake outer membrane protein n=1 Tax=Dyadobacter sp. CY343 TaxID=2907299 RepID=UPI001F395F32|nr:RagB/SusD family nutrient uptake outer membrane protein [Dyadobacter sp. CY343]MCE7062197.1 RagB/SusD family nutrient uptake outer membrane protein [Dyadobacter sp. CY343]
MKKIILAGLVLSLYSCSGDFLNIYPETSLNEGNFYSSDEEIITLVNGCYTSLRDIEKRTHWVISELKSDVLDQQTSSVAGDFTTDRMDAVIAGSDNLALDDFWNFSYKGIYNCNKAISVLESGSHVWSNAALKSRSSGEVHFLRALYYFNLVRQFGDVPVVTEPVTGLEAVNIKRSPVADIYALITEDLTKAQTHLEAAATVEENGRVNYAASLGLLGKVYLTTKNYQAAEVMLKKVIDLGKFSLLPDYKNVFDPANKDYKETLFSVQYSEAAAALSNQFIFFNAPYTSKGEVTNRPNIALSLAGNMRPSQDLIKAFEVGDKRKSVSIAYWRGPDWNGIVADLPYCAKYKAPQTAALNWAGDNFPILRYSDILLMYAEVLNNLNRTAEAIPFVNQVRERAGLKPAAGLAKTQLDMLIEKERMLEFCFENQRWYDLVRRGRALEVMRAHGKQAPDAQVLAAIPSEQILINKLNQNTGY